MVAQYRHRALHCPGCGAFLSARPGNSSAGDTLADESTTGTLRCEHCGGLWIDWFAGDVVTLLRSLPVPDGHSARPPGPRAPGRCPRCDEALSCDELPYTASLLAWACGRCGGRFVALPEALSLASGNSEPEPAPWWTRSLRAVQGFLSSLLRRRGA